MTCTRKKYNDKGRAEFVATLLSVKMGKQFYAVPCSLCNNWHICKGK